MSPGVRARVDRSPANLHITLWFIGEVPMRGADRDRRGAASPAFDVAAFPTGARAAAARSRRPVRPGFSGSEFDRRRRTHGELYGEIGAGWRPLGYHAERACVFAAPDDRPREGPAAAAPARPFARRSLDECRPTAARVAIAAVTLFRSRLSPRRRRLRAAAASTIDLMWPILLGYLAGIGAVRVPAGAARRDRRARGRQRQRRRGERPAHDRRLARRDRDGARRREGGAGGAAGVGHARRRHADGACRGRGASSATSIRSGCGSTAARASRWPPACSRC